MGSIQGGQILVFCALNKWFSDSDRYDSRVKDDLDDGSVQY